MNRERLDPDAEIFYAREKALEISLHARADGRVEQRRRPALVFAELRQDVARYADVGIRHHALHDPARRLLVRAVGPTLAAFGVPGTLADPKLELYSGTTKIAENDNWGGDAQVAAAFTQVGAFGLPAASKDAVLLITLPPGAYTAQASGTGAGLALVEVYEVP